MSGTGAGNRNDAGRADRPTRATPLEHQTAAPTIGKVAGSDPIGLPARDLDRQPTIRVEAGALGRLWVQACSLAGRSHTEGANPTSGQDSYSYRLSDDGTLAVLAIADGLGSRARSHVGAHLAAVEACARFSAAPMAHLLDGPVGRTAPDDHVVSALAHVQRRLVDVGAPGSGGHDLATTLLVAIIGLDRPRPRAVFVRVGDPSALLTRSGRFTDRSLVFGRPADGPANALSACIPMKDPTREIEVVRVGELPPDVAVILVTDGVGNDLTGSRQLRGWLEQRWAGPLDAPGMLDSLRYRRQGSVDDRTAVVVFPDPVAPPSPAVLAPVIAPQPAPPPTVAAPTLAAPSVAAPAGSGGHPAPPAARRPGRSRTAVALAAAGAVAIAVVAVVVGMSLLGSDDGGTPAALGMARWAGPGHDVDVVVPLAAGGAEVHTDLGSVIDDRNVVTSMAGRLVTVDGCLDVQRVTDPPSAPGDPGCADAVTPTLAVPSADGLVVVQGGVLHRLGDADHATDLGDAGRSPLVADAEDVAVVDDAAVFVGPDGIGVVDLSSAGAATVVTAIGTDVGGALDTCAAPRYVAVEAGAGDRVLVAATCSADDWVVASVDPMTTDTCVVLAGDGVPPLPITDGRGDLAVAFPSRDASGTLSVAPLDDTCAGT